MTKKEELQKDEERWCIRCNRYHEMGLGCLSWCLLDLLAPSAVETAKEDVEKLQQAFKAERARVELMRRAKQHATENRVTWRWFYERVMCILDMTDEEVLKEWEDG